jgi:hypothetical protein
MEIRQAHRRCLIGGNSIPPLSDQPVALVLRHLVFLDRLRDCALLVWSIINDTDQSSWRAPDVVDGPGVVALLLDWSLNARQGSASAYDLFGESQGQFSGFPLDFRVIVSAEVGPFTMDNTAGSQSSTDAGSLGAISDNGKNVDCLRRLKAH